MFRIDSRWISGALVMAVCAGQPVFAHDNHYRGTHGPSPLGHGRVPSPSLSVSGRHVVRQGIPGFSRGYTSSFGISIGGLNIFHGAVGPGPFVPYTWGPGYGYDPYAYPPPYGYGPVAPQYQLVPQPVPTLILPPQGVGRDAFGNLLPQAGGIGAGGLAPRGAVPNGLAPNGANPQGDPNGFLPNGVRVPGPGGLEQGPTPIVPKVIDPVLQPSSVEAKRNSIRQQAQGDEYFVKQNYVQAYARYKQAVSAAPDLAEPRFRLAMALICLGRGSLAADEIRKGLILDPQWPTTGTDLDTLFGPDHGIAKDAALQRTVRWAREDVRDPDRLFVLGVLLHFDRQSDKAMALFEAADALTSGAAAHLRPFLARQVPNVVRDPALVPAGAVSAPIRQVAGGQPVENLGPRPGGPTGSVTGRPGDPGIELGAPTEPLELPSAPAWKPTREGATPIVPRNGSPSRSTPAPATSPSVPSLPTPALTPPAPADPGPAPSAPAEPSSPTTSPTTTAPSLSGPRLLPPTSDR